jgi:hypothetical protein
MSQNINESRKIPFSQQEDFFLCFLLNFDSHLNDPFLWKQVSKIFNSKYPSSAKTKSRLKHHFHNHLENELKKVMLSNEEQKLFQILEEK